MRKNLSKVIHVYELQYTTFDRLKNDFIIEEPVEKTFHRIVSNSALEVLGHKLYPDRAIMKCDILSKTDKTYEMNLQEFIEKARLVKEEREDY